MFHFVLIVFLLNRTSSYCTNNNLRISHIVLLFVSRALLIQNLKSIGMQPNSLKWTRSFIENKREFEEIDSKKSSTIDIDCGLLQGDNFSRTFFSIVLNDVTNHIKFCKYHLYADDQSLYFHTEVDTINEALKKIDYDINNLNQWMIKFG